MNEELDHLLFKVNWFERKFPVLMEDLRESDGINKEGSNLADALLSLLLKLRSHEDTTEEQKQGWAALSSWDARIRQELQRMTNLSHRQG